MKHVVVWHPGRRFVGWVVRAWQTQTQASRARRLCLKLIRVTGVILLVIWQFIMQIALEDASPEWLIDQVIGLIAIVAAFWFVPPIVWFKLLKWAELIIEVPEPMADFWNQAALRYPTWGSDIDTRTAGFDKLRELLSTQWHWIAPLERDCGEAPGECTHTYRLEPEIRAELYRRLENFVSHAVDELHIALTERSVAVAEGYNAALRVTLNTTRPYDN